MSGAVPVKSPQEVNELIDSNEFQLIDVRTEDEFKGELGHIPGSQLMTLGEDLDSFLNSQDKSKKMIFICRSGRRSESATLQALELGISSVFNMEGGMLAWNEQNFRRS